MVYNPFQGRPQGPRPLLLSAKGSKKKGSQPWQSNFTHAEAGPLAKGPRFTTDGVPAAEGNFIFFLYRIGAAE